MSSWTGNRTTDRSNWGAALLIDIVLVCRAAYLLWRWKSERKKREKGATRNKKGRERQKQKITREWKREGLRQGRPYWACLMRKSVQGSLSRSLINELWLRRGARGDKGGRAGEKERKNSENKLLPIQYSWIKSWLPFTLIFFHYV